MTKSCNPTQSRDMKNIFIVLLALTFSLSLAACGQRVAPREPAGKITPSSEF